METEEKVHQLLGQGKWLTSINLTDTYFCIPIAKQHRRYIVPLSGTRSFSSELFQWDCPSQLESSSR